MTICHECGKKIGEEAKVCPSCGEPSLYSRNVEADLKVEKMIAKEKRFWQWIFRTFGVLSIVVIFLNLDNILLLFGFLMLFAAIIGGFFSDYFVERSHAALRASCQQWRKEAQQSGRSED